MLVYRLNVLNAFKEIGWTGYKLQRQVDPETGRIPLGASQVDNIRNGNVVGAQTLETICRMLNKQPGDIIEYIPDDRYYALKESGYFDKQGIPTPDVGKEKYRRGR